MNARDPHTPHEPRKRNWLRYRLRTLLILIALVALGLTAWRWYTWPEHALRELEVLIAQENFRAAESRIVFEPNYRYAPEKVLGLLRRGNPLPAKRTWSDIFHARQNYRVRLAGQEYDPEKDGVTCFVQIGPDKSAHHFFESATVERGVITIRWGEGLQDWIARQK